MALTPEQLAIKAEFVEAGLQWSPEWDSVLELDPQYLSAYVKFAGVPQRKGHLNAKTREFVCIAVNAAATHLYVPGIRSHIAAAKALGATRQEIMEVLECTSTLGIHAMNLGVPVLIEVLTERGIRTEPAPLSTYQARLKAEFTEKRGYWNSTWDDLLELDPELFDAYTEYSSVPWTNGILSPKVREFIYIAFDTAATHLYRVGLKLHIENALDYGATAQEVLEVMELASLIGVHTVTTAAPILKEVFDE